MTGDPDALQPGLSRVRALLATVGDLHDTLSLLQWDQQTFMPEGGADGRAEQIATLSRLAHERATDPELGRLLEELEPGSDPETDDGALVRVALRDFRRATCLPAELVEATARATALAEPAWAAARAESDWSRFAPHLEGIVELTRRAADAYGWGDHPLDALLDLYEPGLTRARMAELFAGLRAELVPMVRAVAEQQDGREAPLHGDFDVAAQEAFGREVAERFGYDFRRGRQDRAVHPFCATVSPGDVRITTRFDPGFLSTALFSTLHETGHALYEQNVSPAYARSPLATGASTGVHESQSRLWENHVGRSRAFWRAFYPRLREHFPEALGGVPREAFYRAVNRSAPSPIRVEADELTYDLHVLLRFELEAALLAGELAVADVPAAWTARMEELLAVTPESDAQGALQDIHWASGAFGYFPTYTVGNLLAAQLWEAAVAARPEIPEEIGEGRFDVLRAWLAEHVWRHGRKYDPDDLVPRATGRPLGPEAYSSHLRRKFGELYDLP
ncbi:MAG TPA: carboxypeptidase M32 [Thermoanaerobaculia bacterium]|nr:carboxypeptidase M32 [Thermoanaerobaculia bacterium]